MVDINTCSAHIAWTQGTAGKSSPNAKKKKINNIGSYLKAPKPENPFLVMAVLLIREYNAGFT